MARLNPDRATVSVGTKRFFSQATGTIHSGTVAKRSRKAQSDNKDVEIPGMCAHVA